MSSARKPSARRARRELTLRWAALADAIMSFDDDLRRAPAGTFTREELSEALVSLDVAWDQIANSRPRFDAPERPRDLHPMLARLSRRLAKAR